MPNYWGKSPLRMKCPHCGSLGEHAVVRTDPSNYHWSDEVKPLFERLVGTDISYRRRTKRCVSCEREFLSVELANVYLHALIREIQRLTTEEQHLRSSLNNAQLQLERLQLAVDEASAALAPVKSKPRKRQPTAQTVKTLKKLARKILTQSAN